MSKWYEESVFYHIYPLGFCDAPMENRYSGETDYKLDDINNWVGHIKSLGVGAVYLGPLFQSQSHGYDTVNYYKVDERLGDNNSLKRLVQKFHESGIKVVLDGVFNHVSRDFFAFKDLQAKGKESKYINWFHGIDFSKDSPLGDSFSYDCWRGHYNLVKLNLDNEELLKYLFGAVKMWIDDFSIDGIRLDVADVLDFGFMEKLSRFAKDIKDDFWLMGEVIHGDYCNWINDAKLDSTTNYECYKGMYSSFNDSNFFEIAYSLNRLFNKENGLYKGFSLYNFVDNHDVNRISSVLANKKHIFPLYILLFTVPGVPSVYYGSEWGIEGVKSSHSDVGLRPQLNFDNLNRGYGDDLIKAIQKLSFIWNNSSALKKGQYKELFVDSMQFAFERSNGEETYIVVLNSSLEEASLSINTEDGKFIDVLNSEEVLESSNGQLEVNLYPNWGRILKACK